MQEHRVQLRNPAPLKPVMARSIILALSSSISDVLNDILYILHDTIALADQQETAYPIRMLSYIFSESFQFIRLFLSDDLYINKSMNW